MSLAGPLNRPRKWRVADRCGAAEVRRGQDRLRCRPPSIQILDESNLPVDQLPAGGSISSVPQVPKASYVGLEALDRQVVGSQRIGIEEQKLGEPMGGNEPR